MRCIILILIIPFVFAISEEPYCFAGSDYYYYGLKFSPEIVSLYDNTWVYFDINDDGTWDYQIILNEKDSYSPFLPWSVRIGTKIHSSKPVAYNQRYVGDDDRYFIYSQCIPPITSLKNEIAFFGLKNVVGSDWIIVSPNSTITITDKDRTWTENIEKTKKITANIEREEYVWYVNSTKPVVAISEFGLATHIGYDYFTTADQTIVVVTQDNTTYRVDDNGDGIFDNTFQHGRGFRIYSFTIGSRILSNKPISVFSRERTLDNTPAVPAKSITDEHFAKIGGTKVLGIVNDDTGFFNTTVNVGNKSYGVPSNTLVAIEGENFERVDSDKPVIPLFEIVNNYVKAQRPYQSLEPYITSFAAKKHVGKNDSAIINVRVINPTKYSLDNVAVTIRYNIGLSSEYEMEVKSLIDDSTVLARQIRTAIPFDNEFYISYDKLGPEEYIDIDYVLMPDDYGIYEIPKASLAFDSKIWKIE